MIKKIIGLAACIAALFSVTVYASPEVTVVNNAQKISVKATIDEEKSPLTLKVFKLDEADTYGVDDLIHIAQLDLPTSTTATSYTYEFEEFGVPSSGKYRVIVGGNIASKDFTIVTNADRRAYFRDFSSKTVDTIKAHIQRGKNRDILGFDIGGYLSLVDDPERTDDVYDRVNAALVNIEWPELSETANAEAVAAFETALKPMFEEIIKVGDILNASEADFDVLIGANAEAFGIDCGYYNNEQLAIDHSKVYANLHAIAPEATKEKFNEAFNVAVLIAIAQDCDYGTLTNALKHYDGKGINLDKTYSGRFTTESQYEKVSTKMQTDANSFADGEDIETSYFNNSKVVYEEGNVPVIPQGGREPANEVITPVIIPVITPSAPSHQAPVEKPVQNPTQKVVFNDLGNVEWAKEAIEELAQRGVISGKASGVFAPEDNVTREEFVKIIIVALDLEDDKAVAEFSDIEPERWSKKYIASAYNLGIISGVTDDKFMPTETLTREQMAAIIYRAYSLYGDKKTSAVTFADDKDISQYAKEAVGALAAQGIVDGTGNNKFTPKGIVTRAQAAKVVYGLLNTIDNAE